MKPIFFNNTLTQQFPIKTCEDYILNESVFIEDDVSLNEEFFSICTEHLRNIYYGEKENNYELVTEGLLDFLDNAAEFFKKMAKALISFFSEILKFTTTYFMDFDKFLEKNKKLLDKLNPNFKKYGYEYSLHTDIPKLDDIMHTVSGYRDDLDDFEKHLRKYAKDKENEITPEEYVIQQREEFASSDFFNHARGKVLNKGPIDVNEYSEFLKQQFRSGDNSERDIHIEKTVLRGYIDEYPQFKKYLNDTTSDKDKLVKLFGILESFFSFGMRIKYKDEAKHMYYDTFKIDPDEKTIEKSNKPKHNKSMKYDETLMNQYNRFFNYKFVQSKELAQIARTALFQKINALTEAMKFYRVVIREAIYTHGSNP